MNNQKEKNRWLYRVITLFLAIFISLGTYATYRFVSDRINKIFSIDQEQIRAELIHLNTEGYEKIAPKLGITLPAEVVAPAEESAPVEEPAP
ncbi:MAG: hypothetical protein HYS87_02535 [Candidatus Colwellbacteria bacterium]|nr:hypothetical protein [Candidatus Colwellbacteria bacterium]